MNDSILYLIAEADFDQLVAASTVRGSIIIPEQEEDDGWRYRIVDMATGKEILVAVIPEMPVGKVLVMPKPEWPTIKIDRDWGPEPWGTRWLYQGYSFDEWAGIWPTIT